MAHIVEMHLNTNTFVTLFCLLVNSERLLYILLNSEIEGTNKPHWASVFPMYLIWMCISWIKYFDLGWLRRRGCTRLSNWFSLRCFKPWMGHTPPVWWSTFGFLIIGWCENLRWWRRIFLLISCLYSCFIHCPSFTYHFSSQSDLLSNSFFVPSALCCHFPWAWSLPFLILCS